MSADPLTREDRVRMMLSWTKERLVEEILRREGAQHHAVSTLQVVETEQNVRLERLLAAEERAERLRAALEEHADYLDELVSRPQYNPVLHHQQIDNIRAGMRDALADDAAARGDQ